MRFSKTLIILCFGIWQSLNAADDQLLTHSVKLKFYQADEIIPILKQYARPGTELHTDDGKLVIRAEVLCQVWHIA